jgi:hypothetical protein
MGINFVWKENEANKYRQIIRDPYRMAAVVTKKRSYKGKGLDVAYAMNGKLYLHKTAINDQTYHQYQVGDTISVSICKNDHSLALLTTDLSKENVTRFLGKDADAYWAKYRGNQVKTNQ